MSIPPAKAAESAAFLLPQTFAIQMYLATMDIYAYRLHFYFLQLMDELLFFIENKI
ncbi:hypothetical protein [Vibrio sp.]|uniref:hypothetical protein n=1 Tax=Vibrio sp. TaxID=678 RepID=UPI003D0E1ED9